MVKPKVSILDIPRQRSPLLIQFYENLIKSDKIDVKIYNSAKDLVKEVPDYIYYGFCIDNPMVEASFVHNNGIKIIAEIGDVECFISDPMMWKNLEKVGVDFLVFRSLGNDEALGKIEKFISETEWLEETKLIQIPWGIDTNGFDRVEKTVDVSLICTIGRSPFHLNRKIARKVLSCMNNEINVRIGNYYGEEYLDLLKKTKIFIAESSMRSTMTQKYLEGAMCECMLLGDIPFDKYGIFEDGVTMVEVKDYSKIDEKIRYYLEHEEERVRIAKELKKRVEKYYSIKSITKDFERVILEDFESEPISKKRARQI